MFDLDEARKRCDAATPGPWQIWDGPDYAGGGRDLCIGAGDTWLANMDEKRCRARNNHLEPLYSGRCELEPDTDICSLEHDITRAQQHDAEFIACARSDLPAALDEIERLRAVAEASKVRAYRQARVFEPNHECYDAALSVYAAAFGRPDGEPNVVLPDDRLAQPWELAEVSRLREENRMLRGALSGQEGPRDES